MREIATAAATKDVVRGIVLFAVALASTAFLAYQIGHIRGHTQGYAHCVSNADEDVPSRSYRR